MLMLCSFCVCVCVVFKRVFHLFIYEHLLGASSRDCFTMAIIALFSASEQTHCALVVCDSE